VWKETAGVGNDQNGNPNPPTYEIYFYGATGQKLETYSGSYWSGPYSSLEGINIYFGSKLLQSKGVWVATDRQGSVRANSNGEAMSYWPYGEERTNTANGREKFATYTRDAVGQDYAEQRYYNANMGAFWSPDPGGIKTANPKNPSSWNRYAYVKGNPIGRFDPHGLEDCDPDDEEDGCDDPCNDDPLYPECQQGGGGSPPQRPSRKKQAVGPPSGMQYAGFGDAVKALKNPACATLIAGASGESADDLTTDLWNSIVTVGTNQPGNGPVVVTPSADGSYSYTYQWAYTSGGNIELNGTYFPDPTQQNIVVPGGTASLLQLVNNTLNSNLSASQFGTLVFLHELMHIVGAQNGSTID
jgi:RHS repeat-associated protein